MTYQSSAAYSYADDAKTIIKRVVTDYPANLTELQTAVDQASVRIPTLPLPEAYPSNAGYVAKWSDTGLFYDDVCRVIDQRNMDNPDVQERQQLEAMVIQVQQDIADWKAKVGG